MDESRPLAAVVGENVRRIRGDHTADALARTIRQMFNVKWDTGRIAGLENGRASPTATTLFIVSQALTELTGADVPVADLVRSPAFVEVGNTAIKADRIADALNGLVVELRLGDFADGAERAEQARQALLNVTAEMRDLPGRLDDLPVEAVARVEAQTGEAEYRVAKSLGININRLMWESAALWGDSFSVERDKRSGPSANAQRRGRVSRELKAELKAVLDGDDREL